jgi:hypothetical protein
LRSRPAALPLKHKLLLPGWAGHLAADEFEIVQEELFSDKVLAFRWGFRPSAKRRAEEAIHQVAMHGASDGRIHNLKLVRGATSKPPVSDVESPVSDTTMETPAPEFEPEPEPEREPEPARRPGGPQEGPEIDIPYQMPLFAGV